MGSTGKTLQEIELEFRLEWWDKEFLNSVIQRNSTWLIHQAILLNMT